MTDIPLLAAPSVVRNMLDGRQTQDRRPMWIRYDREDNPNLNCRVIDGRRYRASPWQKVRPGDRLWVRETWGHDAPSIEDCRRGVESDGISYGPYYAADADWFDNHTVKMYPSIHMPRWANRLTLVVTEVRQQKIREISILDCYAEGAITDEWEEWREDARNIGMPEGSHIEDERDMFARLWDSLYGQTSGQSWADNPEVCVFEFEAHRCNIDQMPAAAGKEG